MLQVLDSDEGVSDETLAARVRQGDRCAFDRIMARHIDLLLRIAYGYLKSRADAEDLVQDLLFSIWQNRAAWEPHGEEATGSYLAVAVRRRALNVLKHRRIETQYEERVTLEAAHDITLASTPAADVTMALADEQAMVWQLLDQLPDRAKMVLMLRYGEQKSFAEVASIMGIAVPAARQLAKRALDQLRAIYKV